MSRQVLILNADFSAISICSVPKAFLLVFLDKADLVADIPHVFLRSISDKYPLPSIIRLKSYVNVPYKSVVMNRHNVFKRDRNTCLYCGSQKNLTLDHVIPKSRKGKTNWENLATACKKCNTLKGNRTPEEAQMPLSKSPFKPSFVMFVRDCSCNIDDKWIPFLGRKAHR